MVRMDTVITRLDAADFRDRLPEALGVYVEAMGYPPQVIRTRAAAWLEHSRRDGWSGYAAFEAPRRRLFGPTTGPLVAICYGYHGSPGQWWYGQVAEGLRPRGLELPGDYVELTELHVSPAHQGNGIGREMLRRFLAERPEGTVMLSTPEVEDEDNGAWKLYRSLGFGDVLRDHRFDGDARPFAVLSRPLPLDDGEAPR